MTTVQDIVSAFRAELKGLYDVQEIDSICSIMLTELTGLSKAMLKAFPERTITEEQFWEIKGYLYRLRSGEPVQYIIGHTDFYGLNFKVNPSVLIPRPETEELVQWILNEVRGAECEDRNALSILDIGTGSGCIPITLKNHLNNAKVSSVDVSEAALTTAKENARINEVEVEFINDDILKPALTYLQYDIIVSNPPYVTMEDKQLMHKNVTDFEPFQALFVPERYPLLFYDVISDFATEHLNSGGMLFFEINESFGKETAQLIASKGFKNVELRKDMSGRDRMIKAVWKA